MIVGGLLLAFWLGCGAIAYGLTFGHFQRKFPTLAFEDRAADRWFALLIGSVGPFGVIIAILGGALRYGLKFK